jgi:hypothetical protein
MEMKATREELPIADWRVASGEDLHGVFFR